MPIARQAPASGGQLNMAHPLCKGLGFYAIGGYDLLGHRQGNLLGTLSPTTGPYGPAWTAGVTTDYWEWQVPPVTGFTTYSAMLVGQVPASGDCRVGQWGNNPDQSWLLQVSTTAAIYVSAGLTYPNVSGGTLTAGQWFVAGTSRSVAGTQTLFVNGVQVNSGALAAPDTIAGRPIHYINSPDSATAATAVAAAWWSRGMSPAEHARLAADPFCVLA